MSEKRFISFLIIWSGQLVSTIGSGITAFTLGIFAFQTTQTSTSYALITLFSFLPAFLIRPLGGVLADRFDRKVLIIIGDFGSALGLLFILFIMIIGDFQLWQVYLGVSISSIFVGIQNPAFKASVTDFLPKELYTKASGLLQLAGTAQFLISPIIAGLLLAIMNMKLILVIDIITYIYANITVFIVKRGMPKSKKTNNNHRFIQDMKEGIEIVVKNKGVVWLIGITSAILFFIGLLQTLLGPMILSFSDSQNLGVILTICACGMFVSSLIISIFGIKKNYIVMLSLALACAGATYSLIGLTTNIIFIIVTGFLFFLTVPYINSIIDLLIRKNISNEKQGRAWSFISVITYTGAIIAYSLAGILADNIFNPLFLSEGLLASTIGKIIGIGQGRGIGFIFFISGMAVIIFAIIIVRTRKINELANVSSTTD